MGGNVPESDPKSIWQNQPTENRNMTLKLIQLRSRELRARTRKKLLGTIAGPATAGAFYAFALWQFRAIEPGLHLPFAAAVAWSLAGLAVLNRGMWSAGEPGELGISNGLQFCRREIERQRDLVRRILLWSFAPVLLAISGFVLTLAVRVGEQGLTPRGLPFLVLVAVWIVAYFVIRFREQQDLQRELKELGEVEREGRG